jgi:hypothetical protein
MTKECCEMCGEVLKTVPVKQCPKCTERMKKLTNNACPKCGGTVTGEQVEFISDRALTQDVTCDKCGYIFRHYYQLTEVEEL